eukprot:snap_masked-scaffold_12-processed-gene-3.42-mRNA-1 protein AED:1.00 eAED:1.00 QI:0/0/0/0/1/1/2/0/91
MNSGNCIFLQQKEKPLYTVKIKLFGGKNVVSTNELVTKEVFQTKATTSAYPYSRHLKNIPIPTRLQSVPWASKVPILTYCEEHRRLSYILN